MNESTHDVLKRSEVDVVEFYVVVDEIHLNFNLITI